MLNCYRLHLRENILSYSLLRVQEASRGSAALLKNVCLYACVHIEALNWPPVAIHSLTHTTRSRAHTHTSFFSLSGTLKKKMCVCFLHSHSKAHTCTQSYLGMSVPVFAEVVFVTLLIIPTACQSSVWVQKPISLSLQQHTLKKYKNSRKVTS